VLSRALALNAGKYFSITVANTCFASRSNK
jgi:hypothetical protein